MIPFTKNLSMNSPLLKDITKSLTNSTNNIKSQDFISEPQTLNVILKLFNKWPNNVEKSMINLPDT